MTKVNMHMNLKELTTNSWKHESIFESCGCEFVLQEASYEEQHYAERGQIVWNCDVLVIDEISLMSDCTCDIVQYIFR